jgi:hypothetical protein
VGVVEERNGMKEMVKEGDRMMGMTDKSNGMAKERNGILGMVEDKN